MKNKIKSITEKIQTPSKLPDGIYIGVWGGYVIDIELGERNYLLLTEDGVKGINIKVAVEVQDGIATFDVVKQ
jgi:hypothetical protein